MFPYTYSSIFKIKKENISHDLVSNSYYPYPLEILSNTLDSVTYIPWLPTMVLQIINHSPVPGGKLI